MKDITGPIWEICDCIAEAQAQVVDSARGSGMSAAELRDHLLQLFSEPGLLRALRALEYFPKGSPPVEATPMLREPAPASCISDEIRAELAGLCDKIEAYGFHTEQGKLKNCSEWLELRHLLGVFRH
jgi:hypothetical protein